MTDLKQRLSDKRDDKARDYGDNLRNDLWWMRTNDFKAGFDILAPQIVELVNDLKTVKTLLDNNDHIIFVRNKIESALEKFNKFLGEK